MAVATMASATIGRTATERKVYLGYVAYSPSDLDLRIIGHMRRLMASRSDPEGRPMSRYALAQKLEVDPSTLTKIFRGQRGVSIELLKAIHDKFRQPSDVLLDDDPPSHFMEPSKDEGRRGRRPAKAMRPHAAGSSLGPRQAPARQGSSR